MYFQNNEDKINLNLKGMVDYVLEGSWTNKLMRDLDEKIKKGNKVTIKFKTK